MEDLIGLIKVTEVKKEFAESLAEVNYYGQVLDILNKLAEEI